MMDQMMSRKRKDIMEFVECDWVTHGPLMNAVCFDLFYTSMSHSIPSLSSQ